MNMIQTRALQLSFGAMEVMESSGAGDPLIAFHGNSGAAGVFWQLLGSRFGQERRVISISFPCHGGSACLPGVQRLSIYELGVIAAEAVGSLGYDRYWLLGSSLGGHALLETLDLFRGALGLVLVSAPPISRVTIGTAFKENPAGTLLFKGALTESEIELLGRAFLHHDNVHALELVKANIRRTNPAFREALGRSLAAGDVVDEVANALASSIPITLFAGERDQFLRAEFYATLPLQRFWHSAPVWFPSCGHALNLDDPALFESTLRKFIAERGTEPRC